MGKPAKSDHPFIRASSRNPCPICGKTKFCSYNELVVICTTVESDRSASSGDGRHWGWIHSLKDKNVEIHVETQSEPEHLTEKVDADLMDQAYRELLKLLQLSPEHKKFLLNKGCTEEEIQFRGYKTLPLEGRSELARKWLAACPWLEQGGVPGFCYIRPLEDKWIPFIKGAAGIMHPAMDLENRIQGFQIRGESEYYWMSSAKDEYGCFAGTPCHVSKPRVLDHSKPLFITEGFRKADIASERLHAFFIGVSGVNCWADAIPVIEQLNPSAVVTAWDADFRTNKWVKGALDSFLGALQQYDFPVKRAEWSVEKGKGIDDVLVANHAIDIVS